MKIEIKHRYTEEVLFEHDCDNNTIKITLEVAVEARAYLRGANLEGANLASANLEGANLVGANLAYANLARANLEGANLLGANLLGANLEGANLLGANLARANLARANLEGANLASANLEGANLVGANLAGAYLEGTIGNGREVISAQVLEYRIVYTAEFMWIGCRKHPIKTWWKDSEKEAHTFTEEQKEWRAKNKRWIQLMVKNNPATSSK